MQEQTEIALIKQTMDTLEKNFKEMKEENLTAHKDIIERIDKAMDTKAAKWVENALIWGITLVMGIVITSLCYLVIIK